MKIKVSTDKKFNIHGNIRFICEDEILTIIYDASKATVPLSQEEYRISKKLVPGMALDVQAYALANDLYTNLTIEHETNLARQRQERIKQAQLKYPAPKKNNRLASRVKLGVTKSDEIEDILEKTKPVKLTGYYAQTRVTPSMIESDKPVALSVKSISNEDISKFERFIEDIVELNPLHPLNSKSKYLIKNKKTGKTVVCASRVMGVRVGLGLLLASQNRLASNSDRRIVCYVNKLI